MLLRRIPRALACVVLTTVAVLVPAAGASAGYSWPSEPAMVAESDLDARGTFVLDPGQDHRLTRADLLAHAAYFGSKGFNENFLVWARQEDNFDPPSGARWAGCVTRGAGPTCADEDFSVLRLGVTGGAIPAFVSGNTFIARACGNFSEANGANPMPKITGKKYEDEDGDGTWDSAELGLGNWTIRLYRDGVFVQSVTTGSDGSYAFALDARSGFGPGKYTVEEEPKTGWVQSSTTPASITVPFGAGDTIYSGNDFGNYRPATITGAKYEDMEADGDRDPGDPGLADWTIDLGGSGLSAPRTTQTGSGGTYTHAGLRPGTYTVAEQLKAGWRFSAPSDGSHTITIRSGETRTADFGNYRPATIEGVKFDDHDVDRVRDSGEPGLAGWTIGMSGGRSPDASDVTDGDGAYGFGGLIPGTYVIGETQQAHWRQSAPATGTHTVTVRSGDTMTADFGNVCLGSVEVGITEESTGATITGVEVRIEEISVVGVLANEPQPPITTTGTPTFADLLPGSYRVIAFLPPHVYTSDPDLTAVEGRLAVVKVITVSECAATPVPITLFSTSSGKVTGGMNMQAPGGSANAGFVFMTRKGEAEGSLEFQDRAAGLNLHTKQIEEIFVRGNEAWIGGLVEIDGVVHRFSLHLVDNGEPGRDDRFELLLDTGYRYGYDRTIDGGNVQIHPPAH